jgi:hypothetical protein
MRIQHIPTILMRVAAAGLASISSCGSDGDSDSTSSANKTMAATAAESKSSATRGAANVDPNDAVGTSMTAPQGSCPAGFGCTLVAAPEGSRLCLKRGEFFAPGCSPDGSCTELPDATCFDTGAGKLCTESCEVPSK